MQKIPYWMKELVEYGKQVQQRQVTANTQEQVKTFTPESLWSEQSNVPREQLVEHIKGNYAKANVTALRANSLRVLASAIRGSQYRIANSSYNEQVLTVVADVFSKDRRKHIIATFQFDCDNQNNTRLRNTFVSNNEIFPLNSQGLSQAFANSQSDPYTTKIITRAQISAQLGTTNKQLLDDTIQKMVDSKELVTLGGNQFAYNQLPTALASLPLNQDSTLSTREVPSALPLSDKEKQEMKDSKTQRVEDTRKQNEESQQPAGQNRPLAPKSPSETDEQHKERTSSRLSRLFASYQALPLEENCGEMFSESPELVEETALLEAPQVETCPACLEDCETSLDEHLCELSPEVGESIDVPHTDRSIDIHLHIDPQMSSMANTIAGIKSRLAGGGRDYSKNCKNCGKMFSASTESATEKRKTCPSCGGELGGPNWK